MTLEQRMQLTQLGAGLQNGIVLLESCTAILPSRLWSEHTAQSDACVGCSDRMDKTGLSARQH